MNEKEIVTLAVQGDKNAFAEIVKKYQGRIYNLGLRMTGNEQDAEDILQETFLSALQNIEKFEMKSAIYTWLYRIAVNFGLKRIQARKKEYGHVSIDDPDTEHIHHQKLNDWPEFSAVQINDEHFKEKLNEALMELPDKYRTVFVLRDLHEVSTIDTARILNITESNAKVRLMRARNFLKDKLDDLFKSEVRT
ncbi:MAG: RNA polymerase sigma factor [Fidelibacterota bacterium]